MKEIESRGKSFGGCTPQAIKTRSHAGPAAPTRIAQFTQVLQILYGFILHCADPAPFGVLKFYQVAGKTSRVTCVSLISYLRSSGRHLSRGMNTQPAMKDAVGELQYHKLYGERYKLPETAFPF